jgi:hypothetical protein
LRAPVARLAVFLAVDFRALLFAAAGATVPPSSLGTGPC